MLIRKDGVAVLCVAAGDLTPDVVVVDIGMPLLNGLDAGEQLKALRPQVKVIFSTPSGSGSSRRRTRESDAGCYSSVNARNSSSPRRSTWRTTASPALNRSSAARSAARPEIGVPLTA